MLNRNAVHDSIIDGPIQVLPQWNCQGWRVPATTAPSSLMGVAAGNNFTYWTFTHCWFEGVLIVGNVDGQHVDCDSRRSQ